MPEPADLASTNGAVTTTGITRTRAIRRRLIFGGLVVFVALWTVALIYSVTAGGRSPERLDDPTARAVEAACLDAQHTLSALPQIGARAMAAAQATRIAEEDKVLTKMVAGLRAVHPNQTTPATALTRWLDDWRGLVSRARALRARPSHQGHRGPLRRTRDEGRRPHRRQDEQLDLEQGTRTNVCNTGELQAEVVAGPRIYGKASTS